MAKKTQLKVVQSETDLVPVEVLAISIKEIADGIKKLRAGRLKDNALFLLIQHATPHVGGKYGNGQLSIRQIKAVIEGIEALEATYLKR